MAAVEAKLPGLLPWFHELGFPGTVSLCSLKTVLWDCNDKYLVRKLLLALYS